MNKYHAIKMELDGYRFDSKAEAKRYAELRILERSGEIRQLRVHPKYPLIVNGKEICVYEADFCYLAHDAPRAFKGKVINMDMPVIEDVKGVRTAAYRIKKKLFEALHSGWRITEVRMR